MSKQPGKSIPELCDLWYEVKAVYRLFDQETATPDNLQATHRQWVREAMEQPGRCLLIADGSSVSWSGKRPIKGLGPIGNGGEGLQGFHLHSVLVVRWPEEMVSPDEDKGREGRRPAVEILGLADQQYYVREGRPEGEDPSDSRARKERARESQLWEQSVRRIGPAPKAEGVRWIDVSDRGADIYEHLSECRRLDHGFVIRASQDRVLEDPQTGEPCGRLFETARCAPVLGTFELVLRARPGQPARTATLSVAVTKGVRLRSPQRPGHAAGALPGIDCHVLRVFEQDPPPGIKPLEWILLTDQPVETLEQAIECALMYACRWLVEEFHKALKTGCGAERLQLETKERLFACIAVMSLVALRLIHLREVFRIKPDAPAEESGLDPLELHVLRARLKRPVRTCREVGLAVGRLGGHLNRRGDGMPGLITLWRGMNKLRLLVEGAKLALGGLKFG